MVKVDRRISWHYTTTILRVRIGERLTRYRNCKFHNFARTISRHADGISRYSVPPSAGPLLPLCIPLCRTVVWCVCIVVHNCRTYQERAEDVEGDEIDDGEPERAAGLIGCVWTFIAHGFLPTTVHHYHLPCFARRRPVNKTGCCSTNSDRPYKIKHQENISPSRLSLAQTGWATMVGASSSESFPVITLAASTTGSVKQQYGVCLFVCPTVILNVQKSKSKELKMSFLHKYSAYRLCAKRRRR